MSLEMTVTVTIYGTEVTYTATRVPANGCLYCVECGGRKITGEEYEIRERVGAAGEPVAIRNDCAEHWDKSTLGQVDLTDNLTRRRILGAIAEHSQQVVNYDDGRMREMRELYSPCGCMSWWYYDMGALSGGGKYLCEAHEEAEGSQKFQPS